MILADSFIRLLSFVIVFEFELFYSLFAGLDPSTKIFVDVVIIVGPLSILGLILLLKRIEKDDPDRIRWK